MPRVTVILQANRHEISCRDPAVHESQNTLPMAGTGSVNGRLIRIPPGLLTLSGSPIHVARIPAAPLLAVSCIASLDG